MTIKVGEESRKGIYRNETIEELTDGRLKEIRSDLEVELYYLDKEMRDIVNTDCMLDIVTRNIRDVEIDREYTLYNIERIENEIRKRNLKTNSDKL